jgi:ABC-type uncharacterized transport system involved in gliding motility auxiliary subunit
MSESQKSWKGALAKRSTKFGANALAMVLIVLGLLILVNFLGARHHHRFDTTAGHRFSLSDHTVKFLRGLNKDVIITAFFQGENKVLADLLSEYAYRNEQVSFRFVDPDEEPGTAKSYEITRYGTIVVESGDKEERIETILEQDLTNAILKVTREGKKIIYALTGHGEKDINSQDPTGFSSVKEALENENYEVKELILATHEEVPQDCSVLLVAGPQKEPLPGEWESVEVYLEGGGKLLVMVDPTPAADLSGFLARYGLDVGQNLVIDASGVGRLFGTGPAMPLVSSYEAHVITEDFNIMTFFPMTRSITPNSAPPEGLKVQSLLKTGRSSWGETELLDDKVEFDRDKDLEGPVTIAAVVDEVEKEVATDATAARAKTRLVVFGDSDFASNAYFQFSGNGDLFMNAISWLAEEEDLISIRPKDLEDRMVTLTARQSRMIFYISVILMPLAVLALGTVVWIRRR